MPAIALCILCAACAAPQPLTEDGWGVQRHFDSHAPSLVSISEINAGTAPAAGVPSTAPVRARDRGRHRIRITADPAIVGQWTPGAALFDAELDRALGWLGALAANEPRRVELRLGLMPEQGARRYSPSHPATEVLVIDLLIPVPANPRSRSTVLEGALATGLHEASHALRPLDARDREADEYRASLVAACFRIEGIQRNDRVELVSAADQQGREFTRAHSRQAALKVRQDLAAALGVQRLSGRDREGIRRLRTFCDKRLALPPRGA